MYHVFFQYSFVQLDKKEKKVNIQGDICIWAGKLKKKSFADKYAVLLLQK